MSELSEAEAVHLRRAISLAGDTGEAGNRPFGAVLTAADGKALAEGANVVATTGDVTAHAESVALRRAGTTSSLEELRGTTMFASGEPCPMCTTAMCLAGVARVVFGMPLARANAAFPPGDCSVSLSTRDFLAMLPHSVEVLGPVLEEEAAAVFPSRE